jgi:hypothetical protein
MNEAINVIFGLCAVGFAIIAAPDVPWRAIGRRLWHNARKGER